MFLKFEIKDKVLRKGARSHLEALEKRARMLHSLATSFRATGASMSERGKLLGFIFPRRPHTNGVYWARVPNSQEVYFPTLSKAHAGPRKLLCRQHEIDCEGLKKSLGIEHNIFWIEEDRGSPILCIKPPYTPVEGVQIIEGELKDA